MKGRKRQKLSEEEIDRLVIAQGKDPDAWEEPVLVPPSKSPRPDWMVRPKHLDLAASFYLLSVLHRLGTEASLTLTQPYVDIIVVQGPGHALTIDVKTLAGTTEWHKDHFLARKHHFIAFVCYLKPVQDLSAVPEVYVLPSEQLASLMSQIQADSVLLESLTQESSREMWEQLTSAPPS